MKRLSQRRSILALALSGLVFTSLACDTMESDASKADRRVQKNVAESIEKRQVATTQSLNAATTELEQAAKESDASLTSKIQAKSALAEAEFEAGDRDARELARLDPAISRAMWDISQVASQIQKTNDSVKALEASNPQATLQAIADQRVKMVAASEAAAKKAAELQGSIDKVKAEVATLTQQKDAAMTEADANSDKASKVSEKEASALLDTANESRRKGNNLGHEIDLKSAALLPLERDLAAEQAKKANADQAVAALDENKKSVEAEWQMIQSHGQELSAAAAKLGTELAAHAKTLDDLTKQAATLRAQAAKHFENAATQNASASNDAKNLGRELAEWSNNDKYSRSPERKAWDELRSTYHLNVFKLLQAEALNALGNLYSSQALLEENRTALAANISKTLQEAKVDVPASLTAPKDTKAVAAANKAFSDAASIFTDVYTVAGTPKDAQQAARISRIFSCYGQYLNGDKTKLGDAKAAYKEAFSDSKDDPLIRYIPAEIRG
jgi:DNA repair exonuclease SbcCD ATPase subunit